MAVPAPSSINSSVGLRPSTALSHGVLLDLGPPACMALPFCPFGPSYRAHTYPNHLPLVDSGDSHSVPILISLPTQGEFPCT